MRTLDTAKLAAALSNAAPSDDLLLTNRGINNTLLETVILPFLCGKPVHLSSLNFALFSSEDIADAREAVSDVSGKMQKVFHFADTFRRIKPTTIKTKSFC